MKQGQEPNNSNRVQENRIKIAQEVMLVEDACIALLKLLKKQNPPVIACCL